MVRTRFSADNVVLSIVGAFLACANVLLMGMMYGFGDMPVGIFRRAFILGAAACNDVSAIIFIAMLLWSNARAIALRVTAALFALFSLFGGVLGMNWLPLIVLIVVAVIANAINNRSMRVAAAG
jgi:hypothetical protein